MIHHRNPSSTRISIPYPLQQKQDAAVAEERHNSATNATHPLPKRKKGNDGLSKTGSRLLKLSAFSNPQRRQSSASNGKSDTVFRGRPSIIARLSIRQLYLVVVLSLAGYLFISQTLERQQRKHSASALPARPKTRYTPSGEPIVDRSVLDKLHDIELRAGYTDEDLEEARDADRLAPRRGIDRPAPLYRVPDTKPKSRPAKVSPEEVEALRLQSLMPKQELDQLYCPTQPGGCKFLLPAWIGEQETKAQMHLHQLGLLAKSLGRILVLPNVSKSRMMSCAKQPFDFYYTEDALEKLGIPSIPYEKMVEWTSKRSLAPTAQVVSIVTARSTGPTEALELDLQAGGMTVPSSPRRKLCLEQPKSYLDFSHFSPMTAYAPSGFHRNVETRTRFGELLVNTLSAQKALAKAWRGDKVQKKAYLPLSGIDSSEDATPTPDVLVINYELRFPMLSAEQVQGWLVDHEHEQVDSIQPFSHFPYAPIWTSLGQQLAASLSPFIAIHWRQETLPASIISPCGSALIDHLVNLITTSKEYSGIKTVYLATDYPIDDLRNNRDGVAHRSGTFGKIITEEHHTAMIGFLRDFQTRLTDAYGVRLATLEGEQDSIHLLAAAETSDGQGETQVSEKSEKLDFAEMDAGIVGIIDKTVAMHAELFLTGQTWLPATVNSACGKYSSFTRQITEARAVSRSQNDEGLWSESLPQMMSVPCKAADVFLSRRS